MPMQASFVGRSFPFADTFVAGREHIRQFAAAIGDQNPCCHDLAAARAAGHDDLVAPPTFVIAVVARAQEALFFHPELGLDFSRVVHGDERFVHARPVVAGDELSCTVHVDSIRTVAGNDIIGIRTEVTDGVGAPVSSAYGTLVARGAA
jgi:acyl dehydratase